MDLFDGYDQEGGGLYVVKRLWRWTCSSPRCISYQLEQPICSHSAATLQPLLQPLLQPVGPSFSRVPAPEMGGWSAKGFLMTLTQTDSRMRWILPHRRKWWRAEHAHAHFRTTRAPASHAFNPRDTGVHATPTPIVRLIQPRSDSNRNPEVKMREGQHWR